MLLTVYLDEPIFPYRKQLWCHMWCSDVEYLHQFARNIGLKRSWFQNRQRGSIALTGNGRF